MKAGRNQTPAQLAACAHVEALAKAKAPEARRRIAACLEAEGLEPARYADLRGLLRHHGRVEVHFHPDRPVARGRTVAQALLEEGIYRSQFETGISNGGLTAFSGGDRDLWEARLFAGAYQQAGVLAAERPRYGALNLMNAGDGSAPRFGACYLILSAEASCHASLTYGDSYLEPEVFGTLAEPDELMATLFEAVAQAGEALGHSELTLASLLERLEGHLGLASPHRWVREPSRNLDAYIEAQVHHTLELERDVEALVIDPCFLDGEVGDTLRGIARRYGIKLFAHRGFRLAFEAVPADFRGPSMVPLARRIALGPTITVADIGAAVQGLVQAPDTWSDWGTLAEALQHLKQLWHVLVAYGEPWAEGGPIPLGGKP